VVCELCVGVNALLLDTITHRRSAVL
jgi:hypothetical protein